LLVFKLFPIGYGPTPSKRNNIVLEQEVMKGFELVSHRKKERILLKNGFLVFKMSGSSFSKWWHTRSLQLFQVSGRCGRDFFKVL
jgi:hypothetical protein